MGSRANPAILYEQVALFLQKRTYHEHMSELAIALNSRQTLSCLP
jgi:hypothetical protein